MQSKSIISIFVQFQYILVTLYFYEDAFIERSENSYRPFSKKLSKLTLLPMGNKKIWLPLIKRNEKGTILLTKNRVYISDVIIWLTVPSTMKYIKYEFLPLTTKNQNYISDFCMMSARESGKKKKVLKKNYVIQKNWSSVCMKYFFQYIYIYIYIYI